MQAGAVHIWNEEAKALISGLILHIAAQEPRERRNLATLRDYLTLAPEAFAALLKDMQASPETTGLVARAANRHLGKSDRGAAGVLGRSDFGFADLKHRNVSVFLVLPPDRLSTYSRWLRLLDMARDPQKPAVRPLMADPAKTRLSTERNQCDILMISKNIAII